MAERPVVLVHGLWLGAWSMTLIARRLKKRGFQCRSIDYSGVRRPLEANAGELAKFASGISSEGVDFLAHSLGGLVTLTALQQLSGWQGRVVLLGTPIAACTVADQFRRWPLAPRMLGCAADPLCQTTAAAFDDWEIGMIAGNRRIGLGLLAGGHRRPGDGTVAIAETQDDFLTDHRVLPESHTSLLLSRRVVAAAAHFLAHGRFS